MPKYLNKKSIISFVLIVVVVISIPVAVNQLQKQQSLRSQAFSPDLPPKKVAISNIYSQGFTVSYVTNGTTVGKILYGTSQDNLDQIVEEVSDSGLHHIDIKGLTSNTTYYFKICSGSDCDLSNQSDAYGLVPGETLEDDNLLLSGVAILFAAPNALTDNPVPAQVFGEVVPSNPDSNMLMVRVKMQEGDSSLISQVFDYSILPSASDRWSLELANLRTSDLSSRYSFSNNSNVDYVFYTSDGFTKTTSQLVENSQPLGQVVVDEPTFPSLSPTATPTDVLTTPSPTRTPTPVATTTSTPSIPGDINSDGVVSILDYILLSNAFGTSDVDADINQDGIVSILDYIILSNNFGRTSP